MPTTEQTMLSSIADKNLETRELIRKGLNAALAIREKRDSDLEVTIKDELHFDWLRAQVWISSDLDHDEATHWVAEMDIAVGLPVIAPRPRLASQP